MWEIIADDKTNEVVQVYASSLTGSEAKKVNYSANVRMFLQWCRDNQKQPNTEQCLIDYRNFLDRHYAASTVAVKIVSVRSFYKFLSKKGICADISKDIATPKLSREPARSALSIDQVHSLLAVPDRSTEAGLRDYAIISLMIHTALRCSEVTAIDFGDIENANTFDGESCHIIRIKGKGHADFNDFVKVPDAAYNAIFDYLMSCRQSIRRNEPLFASCSNNSYGHRMSRQAVSSLIKSALCSAGMVGDRFTAHSLRHTSADLAIIAGAGLLEVQMHLRHTTPAMSERYIHMMKKASSNVPNMIGALI